MKFISKFNSVYLMLTIFALSAILSVSLNREKSDSPNLKKIVKARDDPPKTAIPNHVRIIIKILLILSCYFDILSIIINISLPYLTFLLPFSTMLTLSLLSYNTLHFHLPQGMPQETQEKYKKGIVVVRSEIEIPFAGDVDTSFVSNCFIISVEKGLIACPKKVTRLGVSIIRITLFNGEICRGTVVYADTIAPFGIIMMEKECLKKNKDLINAIPCGSTRERFAAGDPAIFLGINQQNDYIYKSGHIINTQRNYAFRYADFFECKVDSAIPQGSPIFNDNFQAVGIAIANSESEIYALKIESITKYLTFALDSKYDGKDFRQGDTGFVINLVVVGFEKTNFGLPAEIAEDIIKSEIPSGGPPELMEIATVVPQFPAAEKFKPRDILYKVDGQIISNDFQKLNEILYSKIGMPLDVVLYRHGEKVEVTIPTVSDTNTFKITRYVYFAGCYFHEITLLVRSILYTNENGIYMTYCTSGSPFGQITEPSSTQKINFILRKIDDTPILNLDDFIEFLKRYCYSQSVMVNGIDLNSGIGTTNVPVDLPFASSIAKIYRFSYYGGWTSESIDLSEYCLDRSEGFINKPDDPIYAQGVGNNPGNIAKPSDSKRADAKPADAAAADAKPADAAAADAKPADAAADATKPATTRKTSQGQVKPNADTKESKRNATAKTNSKQPLHKDVGKIFRESNIRIK